MEISYELNKTNYKYILFQYFGQKTIKRYLHGILNQHEQYCFNDYVHKLNAITR